MDTRMLPVKLSDPELKTRSEELAGVIGKYDEVEAAKKLTSKDLGDQLKIFRSEMSRLKGVIENGMEPREVEVQFIPDYQRHMIDTFRTDTNQLVETRPMTGEELQQEINFYTEKLERDFDSEDGKPNKEATG